MSNPVRRATDPMSAAEFFGRLSNVTAVANTRGGDIVDDVVKDAVQALTMVPGVELETVRSILRKIADELSVRQHDQHSASAPASAPHSPAGGARSGNDRAVYQHEVALKERRELAALITRGELITSSEMLSMLGVTRQALSEARARRRIFSITGPSGKSFYPAFYVKGVPDRRDLEKVSVALNDIPGWSKFHFFNSESNYLGGITPLQAMADGKLPAVLVAAAGYAER